MNIKSKIIEVTASLTWPVKQITGRRDLEITTDPWERTHTIHMPQAGADWRNIEYLHELAHATLGEKHHLLATAYFAVGWKQKDINMLSNPIRVASDWFADDLLMQWVPEAEKAEIREHAEYARAYTEHDIIMLWGGALALAQAVKYLGDKAHNIPRRYRRISDILLTVDPSRPGISAKRDLVNKLAATICPLRVKIIKEDGLDLWTITKERR